MNLMLPVLRDVGGFTALLFAASAIVCVCQWLGRKLGKMLSGYNPLEPLAPRGHSGFCYKCGHILAQGQDECHACGAWMP